MLTSENFFLIVYFPFGAFLAKSVRRCAASVAMARLLERTPPTISAVMKMRQSTEAKMSLFRALEMLKC